MNEPVLPTIVERGLQELLATASGFARLLPRGPHSTPGMLIPIAREGAPIEAILQKHSVHSSPELVAAFEELLNRSYLVMLRSHEDNATAAEEFIYGRALSANPVLNGLFRVFAFAEYQFCRTDLPQRSHEERLTGHVLSKFYSALSFCVQALEDASHSLYGVRIPIQFAYHDLSIGGREARTGADFGVTVHVRLPNLPERTSSVVVQAKVLDLQKAYLPFEQAQAQLDFASNQGAFICFYDLASDTPLPPAILPTEFAIGNTHRTKRDYRIERKFIESNAVPLSIFLLQLIRQRQGDPLGFETASLLQAKTFMLNGAGQRREEGGYAGPSRVFSLSLGGTAGQDLPELGRLFGPEETGPLRRELE